MTGTHNTRVRLLALGFASLTAIAGCSRSNPVAAPPPALVVIDPFDTAEGAYDEGLFVAAANAYTQALEPDSPTSETNRELAIARLALIYSMPRSPLHNLDQARTHLRLLEDRFPGSNQGAPARAMVDLQTRISELEDTVKEMQASLDTLRSTIAEFEAAATEQTSTIHALETEVERLQISLAETRTELETLREIDRQLRQRN